MSGDRTFQVLDVSPARTRRTWSRAAKEMIVAEASVPGANVSAVARAHGASVQQVFRWRREAQPATRTEASVAFVELAPRQKVEPAPVQTDACEIAVAGVILRIGPCVPTKRVVELIRAARLA
ncbi:MAG: transposase [Methylocystis sp.]|uniref:transposase n=1 Tax=Methylocystis sp. TaxID=1911079 RepID=UPI003DA33142